MKSFNKLNTQRYLSIVIPVFNEKENLWVLLEELVSVLPLVGKPWEVIFVDDGSIDRSAEIMADLAERYAGVRIPTFEKNHGQTAALAAGFAAAYGGVIVTMDGDLQNDPHDILKLLNKIGEYDLVCGWRQKRRDSLVRKVSSHIANWVRNSLSGEDIKDVGCSLKAFKREYAQRMKLYKGMHRFFPTLVKMEGGKVIEVEVNHRPRKLGTTKYNIRNRILNSFIDLLAVCWMKKRYLTYQIKEQY